jgi:UDP-glucuronate 4-epimerase
MSMSMAPNTMDRSSSDLNQRLKNEGRNTSVMSRPASMGSLARSSSTVVGAPPMSRRRYVERIPLALCAFFIFWNFKTNQLLVLKDAEQQQNLSFDVPDTLHPQETYIDKQKMTSMLMEFLRGPNGLKENVLVTGAAGFVGMFTCLELKRIGMTPIGYDNVNAYYSTELKELRIRELKQNDIEFVKGDVCDPDALKETIQKHNITRVVHLAAQAGVRYSLKHPMEYTRNNIDCFVYLLETMVELNLTKKPLIFASSSSVYGNNVKIPFRESDRLEDPASIYAATKRSNELIAHTYFNLHNLKSIGLRFFTVYGPFGRPDMAPFIFADRISNNVTIRMFNHGRSRRDFTYVLDIVQGVVNSLFIHIDRPELINLGNGRPVLLADFVSLMESQVGSKAIIDSVGMQKGDVPLTYADISKARRMLAYNPSTPLEEGIAGFISWFRQNNASQYRMKE